jgi:hypothetical protein
MKPIIITIKDIEWQFYLLSDIAYDKFQGRDSHGITHKDLQKVYLRKSSLSLRLVTHEMFHVYVSSCCVNSIQEMEAHAMEEIAAEIIEFHIDDIAKHSKKVYNSIKRHLKSLEPKKD